LISIEYLQTKELIGNRALESVKIFVEGIITVGDILLQFLLNFHPESDFDSLAQ